MVEERRKYLSYLKERLGDVPVAMDNGIKGLWKNCKDAWLLHDKDAEWHLVVQDDSIVCDDFRKRAEAILNEIGDKDCVVAFYVGDLLKPNIDKAIKNGENHIAHRRIINEVALCMRTKHIKRMVRFCDAKKAKNDRHIETYCRMNNVPIHYPIPSLIDHRLDPSVYRAKIEKADAERQAPYFIDRNDPFENYQPYDPEKLSHVVVFRMHYREDDPKFDWRFTYFKTMVLPRLLEQNNQNFDIAVRCNPVHNELFLALSDRIKVFTTKPEWEGHIKEGYEEKVRRGYWVDFVPWEAVVGLNKYDIQTSIDTDDLILRKDFIDEVEKRLHSASEGGNKSVHISFQPEMFFLPAMQLYNCPIRYDARKGSPFFSIYQPDKENYVYIGDDSHLIIGQQMDKQIFAEKARPLFCAFSIHDKNESTFLYKSAKPIINERTD